MKKAILFNDRWLKVISVIIACFIWLYIIIVIDPVVEVSVRDLPIQFVGGEALGEKGLGVVNESATTINLKIKGNRKRMGNNAMKNIIAKVDISEISEEGIASLPVSIVVPFENSGISSQSHYSVDVTTEKLVEKTMDIEIQTTGSLANGYMVGPITVEPEKVVITGPESLVGKITKAGVVLNYAESDVDIDSELPVRFYGTDGKEIASVDAMLKRISLDIDTAEVSCRVVKLREVPVEVVFDTVPSEDEEFAYTLSNSTVQIYGDDSLTSKITSIKTFPVSADKLITSEKIKAELDIPEGIKVLLDISEIEISINK